MKKDSRSMTVERCMDWALLAYAATKAQGKFAAYKFDGVKCTEALLTSAMHVDLVAHDEKVGGKIWVGEIPTLTDAKILLDQYQRDMAAMRIKYAKPKVKKLPDAPNEFSQKATEPTQLDRMEAKLNWLAKEWKMPS